MKNLSLIWNAVLTIAVIVLGYKQFSGGSSSSGSVSSSASAGGKNIVYVNTDTLLSNYDYFKDIKKELENKRYRVESDLAQKGRGVELEMAGAQQKAATMTQAELQATELRLRKLQSDFAQYREIESQKLAQEEAKRNEELINSIQEYLKKYNNDNKYHVVLGYTKGGGILFADPSLEVTQKVLEGLNKEYKAKKATEKPAETKPAGKK
ncbi:MAG: OmpH family outer membrane protein [Spirosomataceae bacterium]